MEKNKFINVYRKQCEFSLGPVKWRYDCRRDELEKSQGSPSIMDLEDSFRRAAGNSLDGGMTRRELEMIISELATGEPHGDA